MFLLHRLLAIVCYLGDGNDNAQQSRGVVVVVVVACRRHSEWCHILWPMQKETETCCCVLFGDAIASSRARPNS